MDSVNARSAGMIDRAAPLIVDVPPGREPERRYVLSVLLREILAVDYVVRLTAGAQWVVHGGGTGHALSIADGFLATANEHWLDPGTVPATADAWVVPEALRRDGAAPTVPVFRAVRGVDADMPVDLFGIAFFCLTRYEEVAAPQLDRHGRFRADATLASRGGWLERPIVNEIAEILGRAIAARWPGSVRLPGAGRICVSHDVDHPLCVSGRGATRLVAGTAAAAVRQGPSEAGRKIREMVQVARGGLDPCWTFEWLMDQSERRGIRSAFYFIADGRHGAEYDVRDVRYRRLMRAIADRGHEIGFHPSYPAAVDPEAFGSELDRLRTAVADAGVSIPPVGGRHHYLRWGADGGWRQWNEAGLTYDSSVGFAARPGFRAGICCEFQVFDLRSRQILGLRERPLVVMDVSLLGKNYLGLSHAAAVEVASVLAARCRRHGGDFVLLWHNDRLRTPADREAYIAILDAAGRAA